jgi:hypothetical protein
LAQVRFDLARGPFVELAIEIAGQLGTKGIAGHGQFLL